ncbi:MAG: hypothetical protein KDA61_13330 [Planctomycetales bacterium]|nr:hypothetical protein [Planctomycetales bacterium]
MSQLESYSQANASCMEHQILEHLKRALRVTLEWKTPSVGLARKVSSVQFTVKSFHRHLERVMNLEEVDGYMRAVAERKPYLDERLGKLRQQHAEFRQRMGQLCPQLENANESEPDKFESLCRDVLSLLGEIDEHDREEIEILQESMLSDEGGEG